MYSFSYLYYFLLKMHLGAGDVPRAPLDRLPRTQITDRQFRNGRINQILLATDLNMTTKTIGKTRLIVINSENNKKYNIGFQVVKEERTPLIGRKAVEDMQLITVNYDNFRQLNSVSEKDILSEFSDVISVDDNSLGTLPGTVHFTTDVTVYPKVVSPKRVPVGLKEKLKVKLQNVVKNGVIQEVDEPTDWVSQMTITLKKNNEDVPLCVRDYAWHYYRTLQHKRSPPRKVSEWR